MSSAPTGIALIFLSVEIECLVFSLRSHERCAALSRFRAILSSVMRLLRQLASLLWIPSCGEVITQHPVAADDYGHSGAAFSLRPRQRADEPPGLIAVPSSSAHRRAYAEAHRDRFSLEAIPLV